MSEPAAQISFLRDDELRIARRLTETFDPGLDVHVRGSSSSPPGRLPPVLRNEATRSRIAVLSMNSRSGKRQSVSGQKIYEAFAHALDLRTLQQ